MEPRHRALGAKGVLASINALFEPFKAVCGGLLATFGVDNVYYLLSLLVIELKVLSRTKPYEPPRVRGHGLVPGFKAERQEVS
jgi:hypothetical protein